MAHDIVIRGGQLVDGTGAEPYAGDLAIDGDQIAAVGEASGRGKQEIDAEGHMVTPGFVDLHTHLDAQIGWDPDLTPVSWHGVTTALMGNCGVTFAPCKPTDKELLAGMMETVEDIPREAILNGLPWNWEGYGGYLDALDTLKPGINVAGMVGHCAVRFYVMGERAVEEQATPEEKRQIADVNVFDADRVTDLQPELVHDFPGGAPRFIQRSAGYKTTLVNGQVSVVDGEHVGVRAGRVLRHAH